MKLGIALPHTDDTISKQFFLSWLMMEKPDYMFLIPKFPQNIDAVRNDLVLQAIEEKCTHLIMMDTDQVYPSDTITKLISHKKPIVGAVVHRRYPPFDALLYRGKLGKYYHIPDEEIYSGKLVDVDATGTGCILYDMQVFKKIPYPWFKIRRQKDGKPIGEDIGLCSKLKKAGFNIFVDTSIRIGHMAKMVVDENTYRLYKGLKKYKWAGSDKNNSIGDKCNGKKSRERL